MESADQNLPFVRCFYGRPSTYLREDELGETQHFPQGEGVREQGDPLMPMLFSIGQHPALEAAQRRLRDNEKFFAFMDDVVFVCSPDRVAEVEVVIMEELRRHSHVDDRASFRSGTEEESPQMASRSSSRWPSL